MMKGLPSRCSSFWPMMRAIRPVEPPGANGTTKVTGQLGYSFAGSPARTDCGTDSASAQQNSETAVPTALIDDASSRKFCGLPDAITPAHREYSKMRRERCAAAGRYRGPRAEGAHSRWRRVGNADVQPR